MGYFMQDSIKDHMIGKTINDIETERGLYGATVILFDDGSFIKFFPNTSVHVKECGCKETLLTNIVNPYNPDGSVKMSKTDE